MAIEITVTIDVPDLPRADVWFASFQAWTDYWRNVPATASIDGAATNLYVPSVFNNNLPALNIQIDGVDNVVPTKAMFDSLQAQVAVLDAAFQDMRTQMKTAGLITNAQ